MKKFRIILVMLVVACICGCNNPTQPAQQSDEELACETCSPLWWYNQEEDAFYDVDTIEHNMTISLSLPAANQTFFKSEKKVLDIWSHYEGEEIPEMSNFVATGYDDVDIWFADEDNWKSLARGDSAINGDFIITLYYGDDTVKVLGHATM